jgi:hypothetical protein
MLSLSPSLALRRRRVWRRRPDRRPVFPRDVFFANPSAVEADYRRFANGRGRASAGLRGGRPQ